jgi:hypothetical protein
VTSTTRRLLVNPPRRIITIRRPIIKSRSAQRGGGARRLPLSNIASTATRTRRLPRPFSQNDGDIGRRRRCHLLVLIFSHVKPEEEKKTEKAAPATEVKKAVAKPEVEKKL